MRHRMILMKDLHMDLCPMLIAENARGWPGQEAGDGMCSLEVPLGQGTSCLCEDRLGQEAGRCLEGLLRFLPAGGRRIPMR